VASVSYGEPPVPVIMPSDQSTWLIAVPNDGDAEGLGQELHSKLAHQIKSFGLAQLDIPSFKVGQLNILGVMANRKYA
jgi:V-type H+-transporting ATPase subunit C